MDVPNDLQIQLVITEALLYPLIAAMSQLIFDMFSNLHYLFAHIGLQKAEVRVIDTLKAVFHDIDEFKCKLSDFELKW